MHILLLSILILEFRSDSQLKLLTISQRKRGRHFTYQPVMTENGARDQPLVFTVHHVQALCQYAARPYKGRTKKVASYLMTLTD